MRGSERRVNIRRTILSRLVMRILYVSVWRRCYSAVSLARNGLQRSAESQPRRRIAIARGRYDGRRGPRRSAAACGRSSCRRRRSGRTRRRGAGGSRVHPHLRQLSLLRIRGGGEPRSGDGGAFRHPKTPFGSIAGKVKMPSEPRFQPGTKSPMTRPITSRLLLQD
jgi:hypothetical protein